MNERIARTGTDPDEIPDLNCFLSNIEHPFHGLHTRFLLHRYHLQHLTDSASSVEFGINRPSELDNIPNFSVAENLPHDIMHDLLEGIVPYELKLLLIKLVNAKYFTIATFNDCLILGTQNVRTYHLSWMKKNS